MRGMPDAVPRIVLDTNVALDLFVFHDAACERLRQALSQGSVHAMVDAPCRDEWLAVLHYPALALPETRRRDAAEAFDRWVRPWTGAAMARPAVKLPRCADPDDQKFLELARDCGAQWLLSKDKALLALARRTAREGWFHILCPSAWEHPLP